ncbi:hypothetical protein Isop_2572 [Isosphaera pallida ATCC 43644]|uniref:Protein tyrosine phosphatase n=1 Tax=Isosphaera pallida (strain ATCC 43644 / DSM 9630 / IS1B) TaxID=575540 RepID=E8QYE8_ISOPI|nr:hypothetical protein [Isosphaera pallida]ADV63143.1 hypothetical protein Isop_2572 [Isosphaera pallida ATCC 43644]
MNPALEPSLVRYAPAIAALGDWIAARWAFGSQSTPDAQAPLAEIVVVCTGNSRRSVLGAALGNLAALEVGWAGRVRFHSAGTTPTACNPRTLATLERLGATVKATGRLAPPGPGGETNPEYSITLRVPDHHTQSKADPNASVVMIEFSKALGDPSLPARDFAAAMVCDEADAGCPIVPGAALRVAIPHPDPKAFDGQPDEAARYDQTRDDLGRLMRAVIAHAQTRLARE